MMKSLNDLYLKLKVRQLRLKRIEDAMDDGSSEIAKQFGANAIVVEKRLILECETEINGIIEHIDKLAGDVDRDMAALIDKQSFELLNKEFGDGRNG